MRQEQSFLRAILLNGVLLLVLLTGGCHRTRPFPEFDGGVLLPGELNGARSLVARRSDEIQSFKALARVLVQYGEERYRFRYALAFVGNEKVRVEVLPSQAFYTLSLLVAKHGVMTFLDIGQKRASVRKQTGSMVEEFLDLPISDDELAPYLVGRIPRGRLTGELMGYRHRQGLALVAADKSRVWFIEPSGILSSVEIRSVGGKNLLAQIDFSKTIEMGETLIPQEINVTLPREDVETHLTMGSVTLNQRLPDSLFAATIPSDFEVGRE